MRSKLQVLQKWISSLKANNPFLFVFILVLFTHFGLIQTALLFRHIPNPSREPKPISTKIYMAKKHIPPEPKLEKKHIPPEPKLEKKHIPPEPKIAKKHIPPEPKIARKHIPPEPKRPKDILSEEKHLLSTIASIRDQQTRQERVELTDIAPCQLKMESFSSDEKLSNFILGLESVIELPKKGNIQLSFEVSPTGFIDDVTILKSDDPDNASYLIALLNGKKIPFYAGKRDQIMLTIKGVLP